MLYSSLEQLVGATPLVRLQKTEEKYNVKAKLFAKLEGFNPAGSVKDRVALHMIVNAEKQGLIKAGGTIIEPTSGNTGIGLAALCAAKGYKMVVVMPDTMSKERRQLMAAYGAEVVLSDGSKGMSGAIELAEKLKKEITGSIIAGQFDNPANPEAHYQTTGPEIWQDTEGKVDIFVAGVGTGGTISGVGRYLKEQNEKIKVVAVEPSDSPVLSGGKAGAHGLQGIGAGFIPKVLDTTVYDCIETVTQAEAFSVARAFGKEEGLLVGISSGAALHAAIRIAQKSEYEGKNIVVLLPDTGDRYLSTNLFE